MCSLIIYTFVIVLNMQHIEVVEENDPCEKSDDTNENETLWGCEAAKRYVKGIITFSCDMFAPSLLV